MSKLVVSSDFAKAHVDTFTRKDGAVVQAHETKVQAAGPKPTAQRVQTKNDGNGFHGEAYSHHIRERVGPDASGREADHVAARSHSEKLFSETANRLVDAGHFENHNDARDYLDSKSGRHLHNAAPDGDISKVGWLAKDVKNQKALGEYAASNTAKAAAPKPRPERKQAAGYVAPKEGDTGHEEHTKYGAYFRKGDKVKDAYGEHHEVIDHRGAEVGTNHGTFHPSKLSFAGSGMQKSVLLLDADLIKAHVDTFTRKDGAVVQAHETKVQAKAKAAGSHPEVSKKYDGPNNAYLARQHGNKEEKALKDGGFEHIGSFSNGKYFRHSSTGEVRSVHVQTSKPNDAARNMGKKSASSVTHRHHPDGVPSAVAAAWEKDSGGKPEPTAPKTGAAASAKMVNVGSEKWPLHAKSSEKLPAKHEDGSTHHVGGFKPPEYPEGGGATDGDVTLHHEGKTFTFTGKKGKHMKTGEPAYEYSHEDDDTESRAWVSKSGHLSAD